MIRDVAFSPLSTDSAGEDENSSLTAYSASHREMLLIMCRVGLLDLPDNSVLVYPLILHNTMEGMLSEHTASNKFPSYLP